MGEECELTDSLIGQFKMFPGFYRPLNSTNNRITSLKFLPSGDNLVAATSKRTIEIWNCNTACQTRQINVFKHGISAMDVLDTDDAILVGSIATKGNFAIRQLNIQTKEYTQQFFGHTAPCTALAVNREKQYFVSVGYDKSILVFDFRVPDPQISCPNLPSIPLLALHPKTDVCALAFDTSLIDMMDLRFMKGPFCRFKLNADNAKWTHFKFSPDGQQLLVSTNSPRIRIINSFTGVVQANFDSRKNERNLAIDASFTPQSDYILTGISDGNVVVYTNHAKYQSNSFPNVAILQSQQSEAITSVEMSTKYSLMATASSYVAFWAPDQSCL